MTDHIVICAHSCVYPEAASPQEFWRNLMHGRRSFRALPKTRLPLEAYTADRVGAADSITHVQAGLITDWQFNRTAFQVPINSYEATDLTHWLALDLAAQAVAKLGGSETLNRERTAVIVANTLTGEFSRAGLIRLRGPFLDEVLTEALEATGTEGKIVDALRTAFSQKLRARFPEPNENTLAGGLANTIAGRIANYFDFHGGAFTVDGACSSSLLAICNGATLLAEGSVDTVVAGAVDLSLDPFELVGFSRNGALSASRMRVFDERSDGFWPGEGAGVVVMMRERDAARRGLPVLARLRGWGMSTDGVGGLTRPDADGQRLACERALERASVAPEDVVYVEAHGTGTPVGDPTEIHALAGLHQGRNTPLTIGSVKANIGHTKAAAGLAGLIKVVQGFQSGAIPQHVTCDIPNRAFAASDGLVAPLTEPMALNDWTCLAGVSSFGFGGINVHAVLEKPATERRVMPRDVPKTPVRADQDAELFLFKADSQETLLAQLEGIASFADTLSMAELADLSLDLARKAQFGGCRLAFAASGGEDVAKHLKAAISWLREKRQTRCPAGIHGSLDAHPRDICLLFPGQAAPVRATSPVWLKRFPILAPLVASLNETLREGDTDTANAQPAITLANLAGLAVLDQFGVQASDAIGHSVGELGALSWAGALSPEQALDLAARRGEVMKSFGQIGSGMARVSLNEADCASMIAGTGCEIACFNGPAETVIAGPEPALEKAQARAAQMRVAISRLATSHAFHSRAMQPAVIPFAKELEAVAFATPKRRYSTTIPDQKPDIATQLAHQLCAPVTFHQAVKNRDLTSTLFVECGPGSGLVRLVENSGGTAVSIDSMASDMRPLLNACAAMFAAGQDFDIQAMFAGRGTYQFVRNTPPEVLTNPCAPRQKERGLPVPPVVELSEPAPLDLPPHCDDQDTLDIVMRAVAAETGLPVTNLDPDAKFQSELHMNSLAVVRIAIAAAREAGVGALTSPTDFANGAARDLAAALSDMLQQSGGVPVNARINGAARWVLPHAMTWQPSAIPKPTRNEARDPAVIKVPRCFDRDGAEDFVADVRAHALNGQRTLVVTHRNAPVSAFLRSAWVENSFDGITLVDLGDAPEHDPRVASLRAATGHKDFAEYRLTDSDGVESPLFCHVTPSGTSTDAGPNIATLLAVGCHRGIGAECALRAATLDDVKELVFVGRSAPTDPDVLETLSTAEDRGLTARYVQCDVEDKNAVERLSMVMTDAGGVALLYAPAVNDPKRLTELSSEDVSRTLAPKTTGILNMLHVFGDTLGRLVAFGSIIGRIGLEGEAHYALANAMQSEIVERFAADHPDCVSLSLEWTVWSGAGMGERLGIVERLSAMGVDALPFDDALRIFEHSLANNLVGTICITGRYGQREDLHRPFPEGALAPMRFPEAILLHYPGAEVVAETTLSPGRDPYLRDHQVLNHMIFPGVMALEAMAQTAAVLTGAPLNAGVTRDVSFDRAVAVAPTGTKIRIAVQYAGDGTLAAAVFSEEDGFQVPCMKAALDTPCGLRAASPVQSSAPLTVPVSAHALYGPVFFHGPRFARIDRITTLTSRHVAARVTDTDPAPWFGSFEAQGLQLGDPALSDAGMHMLQSAVPHRRVLPVGIARIEALNPDSKVFELIGRENWARDGEYSFDIFGCDKDGAPCFVWRDTRFAALGTIEPDEGLRHAPDLAVPLLERLIREELDNEARVALIVDQEKDRMGRKQTALQQLDLEDKVTRRADGKPVLISGDAHLSISHTDAATLIVLSRISVACDIATLESDWPDGVDAASFTAGETRRKLGLTKPFDASAHPSAVLVQTALTPLGLFACIGAQGSQPSTEHIPEPTKSWEAAE